jgi:membrane protein
MGAAVSYYAIFSVAPLLLLVVSVAGVLFDRTEVIADIGRHLASILGKNGSHYLMSLVKDTAALNLGTVGAIISTLVVLFAATGALAEIDSDLDQLWQLPTRSRVIKKTFLENVVAFVRNRFHLIGYIALITLTIILSVTATILLRDVPFGALWSNIVAYALAVGLFIALYRLLPDTALPIGELFRGALITAVLFIAGKVLIGWYFEFSPAQNAFGIAGSLVAVLAWIYYSTQVFFFSASFIFVYSKKYGHLSRHS